MKKFLVILLCAALLCGILPVSAAGSGHFFLTVVTAGRTLVAPCAIEYEAGQTLREALLRAEDIYMDTSMYAEKNENGNLLRLLRENTER